MTRRLQATDADLLEVFSKLAPQHLYSRYIFFNLLMLARTKNPMAGAHYVLSLCHTLDRLGIYDGRIEAFFVKACRGNIGTMATVLDAYAADLLTAQNIYDAMEYAYPLPDEDYVGKLKALGLDYGFCLRGNLTYYRMRAICHVSDTLDRDTASGD